MWFIIQELLFWLIIVLGVTQVIIPSIFPEKLRYFWFFRGKQVLPPLDQKTESVLDKMRKTHEELTETKDLLDAELREKTLLKTKLEEYERGNK